MREIKYKAWLIKEKVMGDIVSLDLFHKKATVRILSREGVLVTADFGKVDWSQIIILEYIGLRDKNEKEIYEGDIINFGGMTPIIIEWVENGFVGMLNGLKFLKLNQAGLKTFAKVEGNIHEHPELLTI